jgi:hypothetical protein
MLASVARRLGNVGYTWVGTGEDVPPPSPSGTPESCPGGPQAAQRNYGAVSRTNAVGRQHGR